MVKCIFSLGLVDKKLFLPFLVSINQIVVNLIDYFYEKNGMKTSDIIDSFADSIGPMFILLIPYLFKYKSPIPLKEAIFNKTNIKYQGILWGVNILLLIFIMSSSLIVDTGNLNNPHVNILCTKEAIEMIFLIIITIFFLKYRYYRHHILSLILFCISTIIIDILLNNYKEGLFTQKAGKIILDVLSIVAEVLNYCYHIYMMVNLYYN